MWFLSSMNIKVIMITLPYTETSATSLANINLHVIVSVSAIYVLLIFRLAFVRLAAFVTGLPSVISRNMGANGSWMLDYDITSLILTRNRVVSVVHLKMASQNVWQHTLCAHWTYFFLLLPVFGPGRAIFQNVTSELRC